MSYAQEKIKPYNEEEKKSVQVEKMFNSIAPHYDKLNHTLSWNIDKYWRKKAICCLKQQNPQSILDIATGTGDFAILSYKILRPKELIGVDISEGMMKVAKEKVKTLGYENISFQKEDCTSLSFSHERFDAVTVAFGVRNFEDLDTGLHEMYRVLKQNGQLIIIELSEPQWFPFKQLYQFYSEVFIPIIGKFFSKDNKAYHYLPDSIKAFPQGEFMSKIINKAGFKEVKFKRLSGGLCTLYIATK